MDQDPPPFGNKTIVSPHYAQIQFALKGLMAFDLAAPPAKSKMPYLGVLCDFAVRLSFQAKIVKQTKGDAKIQTFLFSIAQGRSA